jgi:hypothetical protein
LYLQSQPIRDANSQYFSCTSDNKTPQFAIGFLSSEKQADYKWVIECFKELLAEHQIVEPKCFITDRELALLNTLDDLFQNTDHILCRWHVNMNVVAKTKKHFKDQDSFDAFYQAWRAVIESTTKEQYHENLQELRKHKAVAVKYIEKTWLVWREKIVVYWINKACHFGNITTSRNESSHAAIKNYLRFSTGDHKHFFDAICIFWEDQHRDIKQGVAQAKVVTRTTTRIQLFHDVLQFVHSFALLKIIAERGKLPLKLGDHLLLPCKCSINRYIGLPCFHQIYTIQRGPGVVKLADIEPHWYYNCTLDQRPHLGRQILLESAVVKGKGRPKGSKIELPKFKGKGASSITRDALLHEHEAFEFSSMGPPRIETRSTAIITPTPTVLQLSTTAIAVLRGAHSNWDTADNKDLADLSTTAPAYLRGAGTIEDLYEAGTARERAYMRSIKIDKLGSALVEELDEDEYLDINDQISGNSLSIFQEAAPIDPET